MMNKKKENLKSVNFAVPADHRVKLKWSEKKDKYLDLIRELMKATFLPIIIGAPGTVTKRLIKGLEDFERKAQVETNKTTGQSTEKNPRDLKGVFSWCNG